MGSRGADRDLPNLLDPELLWPEARRRRGYKRVGLGMETDNEKALKLYERVGMRVLRQYDEYSKIYTPASSMVHQPESIIR